MNQEAGTWTARGGATLTAADEAAMRDWMGAADNRPQGPRERGLKGIGRLADWAQRDAEAAELDEAADEILLAMHDLRQVILRRRGDAG